MVDIDVYEIDGKEYYLIAEQKANGETYLYLSNVDDENDILFRKIDKSNPDYLLSLKDENEVKLVSLIFANASLED
jgi:hypothetical protein